MLLTDNFLLFFFFLHFPKRHLFSCHSSYVLVQKLFFFEFFSFGRKVMVFFFIFIHENKYCRYVVEASYSLCFHGEIKKISVCFA